MNLAWLHPRNLFRQSDTAAHVPVEMVQVSKQGTERQSREARPDASPTRALAAFLSIGRTYHPLCRRTLIQRQVVGYYHYERHVVYKTGPLAATYAGAFGSQMVERPDFSYSMALWKLSQEVGCDLSQLWVNGPTGRCQPVIEEMTSLVDVDYWTRAGLVSWLESLSFNSSNSASAVAAPNNTTAPPTSSDFQSNKPEQATARQSQHRRGPRPM